MVAHSRCADHGIPDRGPQGQREIPNIAGDLFYGSCSALDVAARFFSRLARRFLPGCLFLHALGHPAEAFAVGPVDQPLHLFRRQLLHDIGDLRAVRS